MRIDSRREDEMRPISLICGFLHHSSASVLAAFGKTRVICAASVVEEVPPWMRYQKKSGGWITSEYQLLPSSTKERSRREINGVGGRTHEIQRLIGRSLRAAIDLDKLGPRTIYIDCEVIDADGGTRCASITGGMTALRLAILDLLNKKLISESPLIQNVAAVSVGIVKGRPMIDLCYEEDSTADTDMNVVMAENGDFVEIQSTAEKDPFSKKDFDKMLDLASKGIKDIFALQNEAILKAGIGK
ncbi:MAG TPA: ribonuclease PH [Victivallales bacterium]|nr:ribonuclease PH [Victivallales bacterium]